MKGTRRRRSPWLLLLPACLVLSSFASSADAATAIFPAFAEPLDNPETPRHHVKPPTSAIFPRGKTRFSGYRGGCSDTAFAVYNASGLGDVWWPQVRRNSY